MIHCFPAMMKNVSYMFEMKNAVKHFKEEEGTRKIMCEAVERYGDKRALDKQIELIRNLMESMKWTAEQAMSAMKIPDKDKSVLLKRL